MDLAIEDLRNIRVGRQPLCDWTSTEVQTTAGCMRTPIQEGHRRHVNLFRHNKRDSLTRFQGDLDWLPRRIPRRDDIDGVRYRIVNLNHQLTEAVIHSMAHRLVRVNIRDRATADLSSCRRIMIG